MKKLFKEVELDIIEIEENLLMYSTTTLRNTVYDTDDTDWDLLK